MKHTDKAIEITPDGIAAAAATLAVESKYLRETNDLLKAFWYFFDLLIDNQADAEEAKVRDKVWTQIEETASALPSRTLSILRRAYWHGGLLAPPDQLSDDELLAVRSLGPKALAQIREVFPKKLEEQV